KGAFLSANRQNIRANNQENAPPLVNLKFERWSVPVSSSGTGIDQREVRGRSGWPQPAWQLSPEKHINSEGETNPMADISVTASSVVPSATATIARGTA